MKENIRSLLEFFGASPDSLLALYIAGAVLIGLPMALISLFCYWLEHRMDEGWYWRPLKLARNLLHPEFYLDLDEHKDNSRMHYAGPTSDALGDFESPGCVLFFLTLASALWPLRIIFSLAGVATISLLSGIALPFFALRGICWLIAWPFTRNCRE